MKYFWDHHRPEPALHTPVAAPTVGVVVPVLDEAKGINDFLSLLLQHDGIVEIILVDGGSRDGTPVLVQAFIDARADGADTSKVLLMQADRGRAQQMNAGADRACSDVLLFLHTDTRLPKSALNCIQRAIAQGKVWGRFDVRLDGRGSIYRLIERLMNWRSAATAIATGDQAVFVRRDVFRVLGGFANISLMEDIELSTRLKWFGRPALIHHPVVASIRRWQRRGVLRTVIRMWVLRLLYWLGISPQRLARWYGDAR